MDGRTMEALEAYKDEKKLKLKFEAEYKELGERILREKNKDLCDRYFELERLIERRDREVNYWARRVAERLAEYCDEKAIENR